MRLLVEHKLDKYCSIHGFGDGNICLDCENRNWIVSVNEDGIVINRQIHLTLKEACKDVLKRVSNDDAILKNFESLCEIIRY
jgi:hypothetical protein